MAAGCKDVVTLDFETYYDKDYTLKKLSTSEYVRDSRFEAISCGIKVNFGATKVYFGGGAIAKALARIKWDRSALLCHHTHFDGLILTHHFGVTPRAYLDTLSMARALHPKDERNDLGTVAKRYGLENKLEMPDFKGVHLADFTLDMRRKVRAYNARDVDITIELLQVMAPQMPDDELRLIDLTVRMFAEPVLRLDEEVAQSELEREIEERNEAIGKSGALKLARRIGLELKPKRKGELVTDMDVLASNKMFPELLKALGIQIPTKISKYNGKQTNALSKADEEFTNLLGHKDSKVVALVQGRLAAKSTIGETRAARLLRSWEQGNLPVYLSYCGAHTTRWSGGDKLNYQNLKKKGDIRKTILAPEGHVLVVIDSRQIEARVLAWLAGEEWLLDAFKNNLDPYCDMASDIYGRKITKADEMERFVGKTATLGLGFQMASRKFQMSVLAQSINQGMKPVRLPDKTCEVAVAKYRAKNKRIEALWGEMQQYVVTPVAVGTKGTVDTFKCLEVGRYFVRLAGTISMHYPDAMPAQAQGESCGLSSNATYVARDVTYALSADKRTKLYGGLMTENVVQYLARMVVAWQMLKISERYRIVMMSHDEVGYVAKKDDADEALSYGMECMKTAPPWAPGLPVDAEGKYNVYYSK